MKPPMRPVGSHPQSRFARAAGLSLALGALLGSCQARDRWPVIATQRWPAPMAAASDPLAPGVDGLHAPGIEEVLVLRHADPVQVQPAGQPAAFPLTFYDKRRRVNSGTWIYSAPGGRAEILWPAGSSLTLFGRCTGIVGSPARGEPQFVFREIDVASLHPRAGERYQLLGGAVLEAPEGPFRLERRDNGALRIHSQAKVPAEIVYREETFVLDPGQVIDLPLLDVTGRPAPTLAGAILLAGAGFEVAVQGEAEARASGGAVGVVGRGEHELRALGVRVRLEPGERALFSGLGPAPDQGSEPAATPATSPD